MIEAVKSAPEMDRVREFNTGFKREMMERDRQSSLSLFQVRQQREAEEAEREEARRKKMEEEKETVKAGNESNDIVEVKEDEKESGKGSDKKDKGQTEKEHVHNESINVFDTNKLADVIQEADAENIGTLEPHPESPESAKVNPSDVISPISPLETTTENIENVENGHSAQNVNTAKPINLERGNSASSDSEEIDDDDKEFQSELEEDFEERQGLITTAVKEYTTTIKVFETGRKRLANRFVVRAKRRRSSALQQILRDRARSRGTSALAMASSVRNGAVSRGQRRRRNGISVAVRKRRFDNARSRRGSSFVDDYNVNDTLFFDGEEAEQAVSDDEEMAVDTMGDSDDGDDGDDEKEEEMANASPLLQNDLSGIGCTRCW